MSTFLHLQHGHTRGNVCGEKIKHRSVTSFAAHNAVADRRPNLPSFGLRLSRCADSEESIDALGKWGEDCRPHTLSTLD